MGGAASLSRKTKAIVHSDVFVPSELVDGSKRLRKDEGLRKSFVEYVKSGAWLERIARYVPEQQMLKTKSDPFSTEELFRQRSNLPSTPGTERSQSDAHVDFSFKEKQESAVLEGYVAVTEEAFTNAQICCFLFAVLWPVYATSAMYRLYLKYGANAALHYEEDSVSIASALAEPGKVQTSQSSRAQTIFLGCAAFFDEVQMLAMLQTDWVDTLSLSISAHALAISVVHRTKNEYPVAYVNRSCEAMFAVRGGPAVGQSIHGVPDKQKGQLKRARFAEALKSPQCTKLFFPRYTSTSRCVLDGTAVQPAGEYALCAHFAAVPGAIDAKQILMVEDVLAILSCLVPEAVTAPTGVIVPPVVAINTALPFYKRAVLSPVARSPIARSPGGNAGGASVRSNHSGSAASGSPRRAVSRGSERGSSILRGGYRSSSGSSRVGGATTSSVHSFHSVVSTDTAGSPRALKIGVANAAVVRKFAKSKTASTIADSPESSSSSSSDNCTDVDTCAAVNADGAESAND